MFGYKGTNAVNARTADKTEAMKQAACRMLALGVAHPADIDTSAHRGEFFLISAICLRLIRGDTDNAILNLDTQNVSSFFSQRKAGADHTPNTLIEKYRAEYKALAEKMSEDADDLAIWCKENIPHYKPVYAKTESGAVNSKVIERIEKVEMPDHVAAQWAEGLSSLLA